MQIMDRVPNCNGCSACVVGCKLRTIKMKENENGYKYPEIEEGGCDKCNNCVLYCPLYFNTPELPHFEHYYEYDDKYYKRDMPKVYRETMRQAKAGKHVEFIGTLCQIAGLKSLLGDKLVPNIILLPLACGPNEPGRPECKTCPFWSFGENDR